MLQIEKNYDRRCRNGVSKFIYIWARPNLRRLKFYSLHTPKNTKKSSINFYYTQLN